MRREAAFYWAIGLLVLILVTAPYIYAAKAGGTEYVFGGFLLNPLDGNTYLAKMRQGWDGDWLFHLPYTAEPGEGAFINGYYLFLGHAARVTSFSLVLTFHLARVVGAALFPLALYKFCKAVLIEPGAQRIAFALAALGSGMGWLAVPFGGFTSDFWVAEAYPFLAAYANAHFPLGLAIQIWLLTPREGQIDWKRGAQFAGAALLLSIVSPFSVPVVLLVWGGVAVWKKTRPEAIGEEIRRLAWMAGGGVPLLIYYVYAIRTNPVLAAWNAQNVTAAPPVWDLAVSFSPALLLAVVGGISAHRENSNTRRLLLSWVALCLLLALIPFNLQRRFLIGLYVPLACLAAIALNQLAGRTRRLATATIFALAIPTNLVILLTGVFAVQTHDPAIYLTNGEFEAFAWIEENTIDDALVLAGPETGLLIPVYTHARVLYGHPFETVNAEAVKAAVTAFYAGEMSEADARAFLQDNGIEYVFVGPREREMGTISLLADWVMVYQGDGVAIYEVGE